MEFKESNRLFYQKYPYKIVFKQFDWIEAAHRSSQHDHLAVRRTKSGAETKLAEKLENFIRANREKIKMRYELGLSIFFADRKILDDLVVLLPHAIREFYEPKNEKALEAMMEDVKIEVRPKLTHDCRYKILLSYDFRKINPSFLSFYETNQDRFHISDRLLEMFRQKDKYYWADASYFYVKDSKVLLMTQMLLGPIIKKTIKIVTHSELEEKEIQNEQP